METFEELIEKIKRDSVDPETAGRAFFAGNCDAAEKNAFLTAYLTDGKYEDLAAAIHCGFIHKEYNHSDYITSKTGALDLDARYFQLLLEIAKSASVTEESLAPLFAACFSANEGTYLHAWKTAAEAYLLNAAYRDYDGVLKLLTDYDPSYAAYSVLMQVDKKRTEDILKERLLYGKHIRKTAIRKLLLGYKIDVAYLFGKDYKSKEIPTREAIVRLALLYKNDPKAAAFLENVKNTEPVAFIRKLITSGENRVKSAGEELDSPAAFERMMTDGSRIGAAEFLFRLDNEPEFYKIASQLFFSVYIKMRLTNIVIVDDHKVCGLDNETTEIPEDADVGVLHPLELPAAHAYLKRLNIEQPFVQIRRPIFTPTGYETASNVVSRLKGTVILAGEFAKNLKTLGFKRLRSGKSGLFDRAVIFMGDRACVLGFSPNDFSDKNNMVMLDDARFYNAKDFIAVRGEFYMEGVPGRSIQELPPRMFSEFLYALYQAGKVRPQA